MVRLTIESGFCDDSIVGLVTAGFGLVGTTLSIEVTLFLFHFTSHIAIFQYGSCFKFSFTDDIKLGYRIGKVGESLIEESPNKHALRSRLCFELDGTLKALVEPAHCVVSLLPDRYNSAMVSLFFHVVFLLWQLSLLIIFICLTQLYYKLAGDTGGAMLSLLSYCIGRLHIGSELMPLSKSFAACIKQTVRLSE